MLKINNPKNKKSNAKKTQNKSMISIPQKHVEKPEWNSDYNNLERYKISQTDLIQKKISLMSKHKIEAKELWTKRQEKLQKGIIDEETKSVIDTCSKKPPVMNQKNITYFIRKEDESKASLNIDDVDEDEDDELEEDTVESDETLEKPNESGKGQDKDFMKKIEKDLRETREFIKKMDKCNKKNMSDPEKIIKIDEEAKISRTLAMNQKVSAKKKSASLITMTNSKGKIIPKTFTKPIEKPQEEVNSPTKKNNFINELDLCSPNLTKIEEGNGLEPENDEEDITVYFKSLNRIEDTIKFLEEKIIGNEQKENRPDILTSLPNAHSLMQLDSQYKVESLNKSDLVWASPKQITLEKKNINFDFTNKGQVYEKMETQAAKSYSKHLTAFQVFIFKYVMLIYNLGK